MTGPLAPPTELERYIAGYAAQIKDDGHRGSTYGALRYAIATVTEVRAQADRLEQRITSHLANAGDITPAGLRSLAR